MKRMLRLLILVMCLSLLAGCSQPAPTTAPQTEEAPDVETEEAAPTNTSAPEPTATEMPTETPEPTDLPDPTPTLEPGAQIEAFGAATEEDSALYETLQTIELPENDPFASAVALRGVNPNDIPEPPYAEAASYQVGDVAQFWITNTDNNQQDQIDATLMYKSQHGYFWLDNNANAVNATNFPATDADWRAAGQTFDAAYEAVRSVFGEEASPGADDDPVLHILSSDSVGQIGGYFSSPDQLPTIIEEKSNQKEMFVMSIPGTGGIASEYFNKTLAHEFQHMVQANVDSDEESWMNEGLSELAQQIAGLRGDDWVGEYVANLDQNLWYWGGAGEDYGHAYLFVDYLYEQYGVDYIRTLVARPENGFESIELTLQETGSEETFDEVFADFLVATVLNDPAVENGRYAFTEANVANVQITEGFRGLPVDVTGTVNEYGLDVYRMRGEGPATLTFTGAQTVQLVPPDAHSGRYAWWSNMQDGVFTTLTREVDLSDVDTATLNFSTWYFIERDWDYGFVMVSTDDGETWTTLPAQTTTESDPQGNNFGHGFTGRSGGRTPVWINETVDLSEYAGQEILLRFAYVTDEAYSEPGMVIDDISIPEIDWSDDVEGGDDDWVAEGWVRSHNRVPQKWLLRVVLTGTNGQTTIQDVEVVDGQATLDIDFSQVDTALVFISGLTRFTNSSAAYHLTVE